MTGLSAATVTRSPVPLHPGTLGGVRCLRPLGIHRGSPLVSPLRFSVNETGSAPLTRPALPLPLGTRGGQSLVLSLVNSPPHERRQPWLEPDERCSEANLPPLSRFPARAEERLGSLLRAHWGDTPLHGGSVSPVVPDGISKGKVARPIMSCAPAERRASQASAGQQTRRFAVLVRLLTAHRFRAVIKLMTSRTQRRPGADTVCVGTGASHDGQGND